MDLVTPISILYSDGIFSNGVRPQRSLTTVNTLLSGSFVYKDPIAAAHSNAQGTLTAKCIGLHTDTIFVTSCTVLSVLSLNTLIQGTLKIATEASMASLKLTGCNLVTPDVLANSLTSLNVLSPPKMVKAFFYIVHTYKEPYYYYVVGTKKLIEIISQANNFRSLIHASMNRVVTTSGYISTLSQSNWRQGSTGRTVISKLQNMNCTNYKHAKRMYYTLSHVNSMYNIQSKHVLTLRSVATYINKLKSESVKIVHCTREGGSSISQLYSLNCLQWPPSRNKLIAIETNIKSYAITISITSKEIIMKLEERRIEVINMSKDCQIGNTIRFTAMFRNWDATLIDPAKIDFKIIAADQQTVFHTDRTIKQTTGTYFVDYIVSTAGSFVCEWTAIIDGMPSVKRSSFKVKQTL